MTVLVCGGAGYIGSHAVAELIKSGKKVVVFDNFQTGHREAVVEGAEVVEGDLRNIKDIDQVFRGYTIDSVMHFAADSLVGVSVKEPLAYYENNVYGSLKFNKVYG